MQNIPHEHPDDLRRRRGAARRSNGQLGSRTPQYRRRSGWCGRNWPASTKPFATANCMRTKCCSMRSISPKANDKTVHLIGLVSDGGVHSHIEHVKALCDIATDRGCPRTFVHAFTDGRDCDPKSGAGFSGRNCCSILQIKPVQVASVIGPLLCHGPRQTLGTHQTGLRSCW
jgi:hypothetical protein